MKPQRIEYADYYHRYIERVKADNVMDALKEGHDHFNAIVSSITESDSNFRYAPEKWSIKQLVNHLCDSERIFAYRALRFAREDQTSLPGFDENLYAAVSDSDHRTFADILEEFDLVHKSTTALFKTFDNEMLSELGVANNTQVSVLALGYIIAGHEIHHANVIREKYLDVLKR